jgi:hypothetical protein
MMPYRFDGGCPPTVPSALPLRYGRIEACRLGNKAALGEELLNVAVAHEGGGGEVVPLRATS